MSLLAHTFATFLPISLSSCPMGPVFLPEHHDQPPAQVVLGSPAAQTRSQAPVLAPWVHCLLYYS